MRCAYVRSRRFIAVGQISAIVKKVLSQDLETRSFPQLAVAEQFTPTTLSPRYHRALAQSIQYRQTFLHEAGYDR
jgi:hypothetical protein